MTCNNRLSNKHYFLNNMLTSKADLRNTETAIPAEEAIVTYIAMYYLVNVMDFVLLRSKVLRDANHL